MANKSKVQIFTKEVKKVKGIPSLVLVDQKVTEDNASKKLEDLLKKGESYIEVRDENTKTKTVFTKDLNVKNYAKKESKL